LKWVDQQYPPGFRALLSQRYLDVGRLTGSLHPRGIAASGDHQAKSLGGLEIDHQLELHGYSTERAACLAPRRSLST
jgi:hypothetical protein